MNSGNSNKKKKAAAEDKQPNPAADNAAASAPLSPASKKRLILIIAVAAVAVVLIILYFAVINPMLNSGDGDEAEEITLIWQDEVNYINRYLMMFEHIERDQIDRIEIHNPLNGKLYGEQYVDWGFYRYHSENGEDDGSGYVDGDLYMIGYEYAPYDSTKISYLINAAGMTICSARVEDHCTDYSRYGLEFEDEDDIMHFSITKTDGTTYKVYIGNMLPSGNGYYARVAGSDVLREDGTEQERDSVYLFSNTYIGISLMAYAPYMTDPYVTYPLDLNTKSTLDMVMFHDFYNDFTFSALPVKSASSDPFSPFSGSSIYYTVEPGGYYASTAFEDLVSTLSEFKGSAVLELGSPVTTVDEETGEEVTDYGLTQEQLKKYGLDKDSYRYELYFVHLGIANDVIFSDLQTDASGNRFYYAYSFVFNSLLYISYEDAAFLRWHPSTYINTAPLGLSVYNCETYSIKGSYNDLGIEYPDRKGVQEVDETFRVGGNSTTVTVTRLKTGETVERYNFSRLYLQTLYLNMREEIPEEERDRILAGTDPACEFTISSRAQIIYKTDAAGNETTEVDYTLPSVTRIYRFYPYTSGKMLLTIESINEKGKSSGETGSYYVMAAKVDQILSLAISVANDIVIDGNVRY